MSDSRQAANVRLDLTAVRGWLDLLHGTSPGLVSIVSTLNWGGEFFDLSTQADEAAAYVRGLDNQGAQGTYLRTTTLGGVPEKDEQGRTRRGSIEESLSLPGFAGDIDIAGPGHKTKNLLPPDVPTAMSIVHEAGLPEPTLWVHSGGGIYPWWLLESPYDVSIPERLSLAQDLASKIQLALKRSAARLGWHYGGEVGELARVLRIPGTVNRKEGLARPCEVLEPAGYEFYSIPTLLTQVNAALLTLPEDKPVLVREPARPIATGSDLKPGEEYELRNDWGDVLQGHFEYVCHRGQARMWLRLGSTSGARWSATSGRASDRDRLYLFTSEVPGLEANQPYTKFAVYTFLNHGGDFKAATKALAALGYGAQRTSLVARQPRAPAPPVAHAAPVASAEVVAPVQGELVSSAPLDPESMDYAQSMSDVGIAERTRMAEGRNFRYNTEQKAWYVFEGEAWERDYTFAIDRAVDAMALEVIKRGFELKAQDPKAGQKMINFGVSCRNDAKAKATIARLATLPGMSVRDSTFDAHPHLITMANGVLNLRSGQLGAFDRELMLSRRMPVFFDPYAKCRKFEKFMAQLVPDPELRGYVQRAMGYTLAGKVDHRAIFLLYGPPKTGKSQFLKLMGLIFGSFGGTAASDTLRVTQSTQSNNLHGLKGKRFVSTSETSVDTRLDEELIKRLTGGDTIVSRDLYEKNQEWQPECTIFMATNALPRLSVDDSAIWTRVKPIPFLTQFSAGGNHKEIHNISQMLFESEASGIVNWLLDGLRDFEANGLGEPGAVTTSVADHKRESDAVATFIADALDESLIFEDSEALISSSQLFAIYQGWSARQGMKPLGMRRFVNRMRILDDGKYLRVKNNLWFWKGLKPGAAGMLGSM